MVWVPAKMMLLAEAVRPPLAVKVQLRVVRRLAVMVRVLAGSLMFTTFRVSIGAAALLADPLQVCGTVPLMSSVAVPPVNAVAMLMSPWAASVPVAPA